MAVSNNGTSGRYLSAGSSPIINAGIVNGPYTIMAWVYPTSVSAYNNLCFCGFSSALQIEPGGQWSWYDGSADKTFGAATLNTWQHVAIVRTSSTAITAYLDGSATSLTVASGGTASATQYIGAWDSSADHLNGRIAAFKVFSQALSASEIAQEMAAIAPVTAPQNVRLWLPMIDGTLSDIGRDFAQPGRHFAVTGSLTLADGPPVSWGAGVLVLPVVASGGASEEGAATLAGAGTLVASAGVARPASAALSGVGSLSGAPRRGRATAGTLAGTGTLAASGRRARVASAGLSGAGTLAAGAGRARVTSPALAGAGSLTADARRARAGTVALAGSGSLAASAARLRRALAALGGIGTLAASGDLLGALTGAAALAGSGTLAAAGRRGRSAASALAGTGTLAALGTRDRIAGATLVGAGILTASALRTREAAAWLAGVGQLSAAGTTSVIVLPARVEATGALVLAYGAGGALTARTEIAGRGSIAHDPAGGLASRLEPG